MNQQKILLNLIDNKVIEIKNNKKEISCHDSYFKGFIKDNANLLVSLLIPMLVLGWVASKKNRTGHRSWAIIRFLTLNLLRYLRSYQ